MWKHHWRSIAAVDDQRLMQNISSPGQIQPSLPPLLQSSPLILYLWVVCSNTLSHSFDNLQPSTIQRFIENHLRLIKLQPFSQSCQSPSVAIGNAATEHPVDTAQLQTSTEQLQTSTAAIPTDAAVGDDNKHPKSSPLYFPPSDPFESEDENEVPSASMAVSEPHHSERGTVAAITSARKT